MIIMLPHGTDTKTLSFFISCCFATMHYIHTWYFQFVSSLSSNDFTSCSPSMSQEMVNFPGRFYDQQSFTLTGGKLCPTVPVMRLFTCYSNSSHSTKQGWHLFCLAFPDVRDYSREATNGGWRLIVEIWYPCMQDNNYKFPLPIQVPQELDPRLQGNSFVRQYVGWSGFALHRLCWHALHLCAWTPQTLLSSTASATVPVSTSIHRSLSYPKSCALITEHIKQHDVSKLSSCIVHIPWLREPCLSWPDHIGTILWVYFLFTFNIESWVPPHS